MSANVGATKPLVAVFRSDVVLGSGANNDSAHVDARGARAIAFLIKASDATQLTTASPQVLFQDGRQATLAPGAIPGGTDTGFLNCSGALTALDLSTTTSRMCILRSNITGTFAVEPMYGVDKAWITLTRAVAGGTTTYTVWTLVYFNS